MQLAQPYRDLTVCVAAVAIVLTACANGGPRPSALASASGSPASPTASVAASAAGSTAETPGEGHVAVTLQCCVIKMSAASAQAGEVVFDVKNIGPTYERAHEFVVIRTDLDAADLPQKDETAIEDGLDIVGRTAEVAGGESATLTLTLTAGHYVAICNIAGHYYAMRENFVVQ